MDVFGDPELFAEFEKPREPSDRLLMETLDASRDKESSKYPDLKADGASESGNDHAKFSFGSSDEESESDDEDNENLEQSHDMDVDYNGLDETESINTESKQNGSSNLQGNAAKNMGDNRGSDHVVGDLRREIERLKNESILLA